MAIVWGPDKKTVHDGTGWYEYEETNSYFILRSIGKEGPFRFSQKFPKASNNDTLEESFDRLMEKAAIGLRNLYNRTNQ